MEKKTDQQQQGTASGKIGGINNDLTASENQLDPWQTPLCELPGTLVYAAVVDVRNSECVITENMVTQACHDIEAMQQFPFAPRKSAQLN